MADYSWPEGPKRRLRDFFRADGGAELIGARTVNMDVPQPLPADEAGAQWRVEEEIPSVGAINDGWGNARGLGHMCLPPDIYPSGWGAKEYVPLPGMWVPLAGIWCAE